MEIERYQTTLSRTRELTLEYIDDTIDREDALFKKVGASEEFLSMTPRQVIEEWKDRNLVDEVLSTKVEVKKRSFGGRPVNLFYGDFWFWLKEKYDVTDEDLKEYFGEYETNCAQYAAFMTTLIGEILPDLSPTIFYGDARVMRGGVFDENRMEHFWVELSNGMLLDNSGVFKEIFDNFRPLAYNNNFVLNESGWQLIDEATDDGGWYRTEVIKFFEKAAIGGVTTKVTGSTKSRPS